MMLLASICLELVAFAAVFGVGGSDLGLAVLVLTVALLLLAVRLERRQAHRIADRRMWVYYAVNDRFSEKAHARALVKPEFAKAMDRRQWIYLQPSVHGRSQKGARFQF